MPSVEPYSPLPQGSTQAQDALGAFPTGAMDGEGKAGVITGGLDSLSEYTLPGEQRFHLTLFYLIDTDSVLFSVKMSLWTSSNGPRNGLIEPCCSV